MNTPLISVRGIRKAFVSESLEDGVEVKIDVLKGLDLDIFAGDALCIMGSSGEGKSTLLHLLGALDRPTLGSVRFQNQDLTRLTDDQLSSLRNKSMSFVFQFHHLLSEFTALENVMMPSLIGNQSFSQSKRVAESILNDLGLTHRLHHRPSALSGGEQQRVAIARALVVNPQIIFADEPTGNLDRTNGLQVQQLLFDLHKKRGLTLVTVTHDQEFARRFPKVKILRDGLWA